MPEMKHCDVCDIDLQKRSYNRHLASQRHIRALRQSEESEDDTIRSGGRAGVGNPELEALRAEHAAWRAEIQQSERHTERDTEQDEREAARDAEFEAEQAERDEYIAGVEAQQAARDAEFEAQQADLRAWRAELEAWRAEREAEREAGRERNRQSEKLKAELSELCAEYKAAVRSNMKILGLIAGFTARDLRKAYKRAAVVTHPDKGGSNMAFREVHDAYEHLKAL